MGMGVGPPKSRALEESPLRAGQLFGRLIQKSLGIVLALPGGRPRSGVPICPPSPHTRNMPGNWGPLCTPVFHSNASVRVPISAMATLRQSGSLRPLRQRPDAICTPNARFEQKGVQIRLP